MNVLRKSNWTYSSANSIGGGDLVVGEAGEIVLKDPSGKEVKFIYGGVGAGWSAGLKLPKVGHNTLTGSIPGLPDLGAIYILDTFRGSELKSSDIAGVCKFVEIGGGVVIGGSATAMVMGMDVAWLAAEMAAMEVPLAIGYADSKLIQSATSILFMAGIDAGIQAGFGVAGYAGGLVCA